MNLLKLNIIQAQYFRHGGNGILVCHMTTLGLPDSQNGQDRWR